MKTSASPPSENSTSEERKSRRALFLTFLKIGLCGFGGVAPWAHRVLVEERRWLNGRDYAELLGVASVLPGANTVNIAVLLGDRYAGLSGSLCALAGLLLMPLALLTAIATLYERFAAQSDVKNAVICAGAATAGLVVGTGVKMMRNLKPDLVALLAGGGMFIVVGLLQASLTLSLLIAIATSLVMRVAMGQGKARRP